MHVASHPAGCSNNGLIRLLKAVHPPRRTPHVFPCSHAFCAEWITRLTRRRTLDCPNFRQHCSASDVGVDFALRDSLGLDGSGMEAQGIRPCFGQGTQSAPLLAPAPPEVTAEEKPVSMQFIPARTGSDVLDILVSVMPPAGKQRSQS